MVNRTWDTYPLNFDNVFKAMLTLYTSSTGEGWPRYIEYLLSSPSPQYLVKFVLTPAEGGMKLHCVLPCFSFVGEGLLGKPKILKQFALRALVNSVEDVRFGDTGRDRTVVDTYTGQDWTC